MTMRYGATNDDSGDDDGDDDDDDHNDSVMMMQELLQYGTCYCSSTSCCGYLISSKYS